MRAGSAAHGTATAPNACRSAAPVPFGPGSEASGTSTVSPV